MRSPKLMLIAFCVLGVSSLAWGRISSLPHRVLFVGDSHTAGLIGGTIIDDLAVSHFASYVKMDASVGSKPSDWVNGSVGAQPYVDRVLDNNQVTEKAETRVLQKDEFANLENSVSHDLDVIALGANLLGSNYSHVLDEVKMVFASMSSTRACIWVGPPRMNLDQKIKYETKMRKKNPTPQEDAAFQARMKALKEEKNRLEGEDKVRLAGNYENLLKTALPDDQSLWFKVQRAVIEARPSCHFISTHAFRFPADYRDPKKLNGAPDYVMPHSDNSDFKHADGLHFSDIAPSAANGGVHTLTHDRATLLADFISEDIRQGVVKIRR